MKHSDSVALRELAHPAILPETLGVFTSLGATAWLASSLASNGQPTLAGTALVGLLGTLVGLKRLDRRARGTEGLADT